MTEQDLVELIIEEDKAYREGAPLVSDVVFDCHLQRLRDINPNHWIIQKSGRISHAVGTKGVNHLVYPIETIKTRIKVSELQDKQHLFPDIQLTIEPKLDGGSIIVYYIKGTLAMAVTGSEEYEGVDITDNIRHAVPNFLPVPLTLAVGGEGIVTNEDFKETFEPLGYANPRNTATGIMRAQNIDQKLVKKLRFVACYTLGEDKRNNSQYPNTSLTALGFEKVKNIKLSKSDFLRDTKDFVNKYPALFILRDGSTFAYDGLVIKDYHYTVKNMCNDNWDLLELKTEIAFKFQEEVAITTVKNIEYNVSRTGRVVPVWIVEPVKLAGATISRVTGNNFAYVKDKKAGIGAVITIIRSNEVIPKHQETLSTSEEYIAPETCPECHYRLVEKGVDLFCGNPFCATKQRESIYRMFEKLEIEGIGRTLIDELLDEANVNDIDEFAYHVYNDYDWAHRVFGFGSVTAQKFSKALDMLETMIPTITDILWFCNIPSIGHKVCEQYGQIDIQEFIDVFGMDKDIPREWEKYSVNYLNFDKIVEHRDVIKSALKFFNYDLQSATKITGLDWKVAVTGSVALSRKEWYEQLRQFGVGEGSVSKGTKYLVCNATVTNTNKFEKAIKQGLEIITEEDLYKVIAKELGIDSTVVLTRMGI